LGLNRITAELHKKEIQQKYNTLKVSERSAKSQRKVSKANKRQTKGERNQGIDFKFAIVG